MFVNDNDRVGFLLKNINSDKIVNICLAILADCRNTIHYVCEMVFSMGQWMN